MAPEGRCHLNGSVTSLAKIIPAARANARKGRATILQLQCLFLLARIYLGLVAQWGGGQRRSCEIHAASVGQYHGYSSVMYSAPLSKVASLVEAPVHSLCRKIVMRFSTLLSPPFSDDRSPATYRSLRAESMITDSDSWNNSALHHLVTIRPMLELAECSSSPIVRATWYGPTTFSPRLVLTRRKLSG